MSEQILRWRREEYSDYYAEQHPGKQPKWHVEIEQSAQGPMTYALCGQKARLDYVQVRYTEDEFKPGESTLCKLCELRLMRLRAAILGQPSEPSDHEPMALA